MNEGLILPPSRRSHKTVSRRSMVIGGAIAYTTEIAQLKTPALITVGASIGSNESAHAAAIRAAFISLGVGIDYVPASFVSADTRSQWVLKV